ncbi:unnamed protein product [Rhizophagus irregularis]|uniref:FAR1 domain-containing protein n=1 Tax=Rhizophagus irregularis TaxID=588596 RepID=A0A916E9Y8_9GLOM|nr:unnamed protein product [Rhizophagus irregularis]
MDIKYLILIVETEDIPKDIKFDTWDEVDNYFDDYGARNGFAIIKYKMKRNSKGQVHKRTLVCKFSEKYKSKKLVKAASKET